MIDYHDFTSFAQTSGRRGVILARHGERPHIDPADTTFGSMLPLTAGGEALARSCGRSLREAGDPSEWTFGASAFRRTRLTAAYVAEEIGADPATVEDCAEVGIPGLWIEDAAVVHECQLREGVRNYHERQMRDGWADGFLPSAESARKVLKWVAGPAIRTRLAFFSTHDCHLGCLLNATGAACIRTDHWVGFLQGCALLEQPDGTWQAHYLVPDKAHFENLFVF